MSDLFVVFTIGLLGSAHCIGMCGGLVLAVTQMNPGRGGRHLHQSLYFVGKTATYALFGVAAGAFGAAIGLALSGFQGAVSVTLGVAMVAIGLGLCGVTRRFEGLQRFPGMRAVSGQLGRLMGRRTPAATFGLGMLNGLLPCGLVYAMLVKAAATGSVAGGAATMAVFGLATIPALYVTGMAGFLLRPQLRLRLSQVGGVMVILLGLLTVFRGAPALAASLDDSPETVQAEEHPPGCPLHP
jgi:uncharacterized protein